MAPTPTTQRRRWFRRYAIASTITIAYWTITTALLFLLGVLTFTDGNVFFDYTPSPSSAAPLGAPTISTHLFYVNISGAIVIWCVAVLLVLAVVNGFVAFGRGKAVV